MGVSGDVGSSIVPVPRFYPAIEALISDYRSIDCARARVVR